MLTEVSPLLVRKYNQAIPRYTSYPTVPNWNNKMTEETWKEAFHKRFDEVNHTNGISIYIHLPFCESLCTYCGCNKKITTNHSVEDPYIAALEKEWKIYKKLMNQTPVIREIHLGGGTPTFFSPKNLKKLINTILKDSIVHPQHEFSIEGHPNNTTEEHLKTLYNLGFKRISFGVQDNDPEVQRIINRIQPFENVARATETARKVGFTSVNFDLIYGLPKQNLASIERTINQVLTLQPDRIAFYSYAHVPWTSKGQRLFDENDLPSAEDKILLYLKGKSMLMNNGYFDIGMDHFSLPHDELYTSWKSGKLHRNFMGYTTHKSGLLLGLGVSSISDATIAYGQNEKQLQKYYEKIAMGVLPLTKGCSLTEEDLAFKQYILDIACKAKTCFNPEHLPLLKEYSFPKLKQLESDGLIKWNEEKLELTEQGHYFIRNICSAFDLYLARNSKEENQIFSQAI
jgi:oxygen-independent coproporphyrinogen III oxidase